MGLIAKGIKGIVNAVKKKKEKKSAPSQPIQAAPAQAQQRGYPSRMSQMGSEAGTIGYTQSTRHLRNPYGMPGMNIGWQDKFSPPGSGMGFNNGPMGYSAMRGGGFGGQGFGGGGFGGYHSPMPSYAPTSRLLGALPGMGRLPWQRPGAFDPMRIGGRKIRPLIG